jgi:uncharacterized protein YodC (DUF2158 family)
MSKFTQGDVVWLKSGGPPMVVIGAPVPPAAPAHYLTCAWISPAGEPQQAHYPEEALVSSPPAAVASRVAGGI